MEEQMFTPEEWNKIETFSRKIDITDSEAVFQYGAGAQREMTKFSDSILSKVQSEEMGEVGDLLLSVSREVGAISPEPEKKGLFGLFKRTRDNIDNIRGKYNTVLKNIQQICSVLEKHQLTLMKDAQMLDNMYQINLKCLHRLDMYIAAGKKKMEEVRQTELPMLTQKALQTGQPMDQMEADERARQCDWFDKKLHDLELTRMVALQMGPQIRMVQNNDVVLSEKIESVLVNTIPLWKSQMVLALGLANTQEAMKAQNQVTNATNDMLRRNARALEDATLETARESRRGIVDLETLKETNARLISTLDETMRIQEEGKTRRIQAEKELGRLEQELKQKVQSTSAG